MLLLETEMYVTVLESWDKDDNNKTGDIEEIQRLREERPGAMGDASKTQVEKNRIANGWNAWPYD